jgi:hypothetical protein
MADINRSKTPDELDRLIAEHRSQSKAVADKTAAEQAVRQQQRDASLDQDGVAV